MKLNQELNQYNCSMFRDQEYPTHAWFYEQYREGDIPEGAIIGIFKAFLANDQDQYIVWSQGSGIGMSKQRYKEKKGI